MTPAERAEYLGIKVPTKPTLAKYGLDADGWLALLERQGWVCPICEKRATTWNTDHEHAPNWARMAPARRAEYVRGVLCWHCNHRVVGDKRDAAQAQRVADYLRAHEERRAAR